MQFLPTNIALKRSTVTSLLLMLVIFVGWAVYKSLPKEWAPDVQVPFVNVIAVYPGAAPEDVEQLVTSELEKELQGLKGLKKMTSSSVESQSLIYLEFDIGFNVMDAKSRIRDATDKAKPKLPKEVEDILIKDINIAETPIVNINISGNLGLEPLRIIAKELKEEIETINGVLEVKRIGGLEREVQVNVDPKKLEYLKVSLQDVIDTIRAENKSIPSGSLDIGPTKYLVRVLGQIQDPSELNSLIIAAPEGRPIYVRDVAEVRFGFKELTTRSRLYGVDSISLSVSKRSGSNILKIADSIKVLIEQQKQRYASQQVKLTYHLVDDGSEEIRSNVSDLENNIFSGLLFVVLVLLLAIGARNALLVGTAIPLSMLLSFIILNLIGTTLNFIVLFSLILALGMLVDNGIVIVENIYRHLQTGKSRLEATKTGVGEVAYPVITSTLTTLAAFLPLLGMPGIIGEFMYYLPLTLIITLSSSLFVALIFLPVLCQKFIRLPSAKTMGKDEIALVEQSAFLRKYKRFLMFCMRHRLKTLGLVLITWFGLIAFYVSMQLGVEFFPSGQPRSTIVNISAPTGTTFEESERIVSAFEESLLEPYEAETNAIVANVGQGRQGRGGGSVGADSHILLSFPSWQHWDRQPTELIAELRDNLLGVAGAKVTVTRPSSGPPTGKPVNLELYGKDLKVLDKISAGIQKKIQNIKGLINLDDDLDLTRPEIRIRLDREKLARYGFDTQQVASMVRTAVRGTDISTFRRGPDDYDIIVRIAKEFRDTPQQIENLVLITKGEQNVVRVGDIANIERGPSFGAIQHSTRKRVVSISADAASGFSGAVLLGQVKEIVKDVELPEGYSIQYTGEDTNRQESQSYLGNSFIVAMFLIYMILVAQFNSLVAPLIILSSVVLSLAGVFLGLSIHQQPFGIIMGGIGTISLAGIVVNNSIVLIDYTKQLQKRNLPLNEALVLAGMVRLRPVVLTAVTTILGLMPITMGMDINFYRFPNVISFGSASGEIWLPMAYTVIYGLLVATLLTLVVVPVLYSLTESMRVTFSLENMMRIVSKLPSFGLKNAFLSIVKLPTNLFERIAGFMGKLLNIFNFMSNFRKKP